MDKIYEENNMLKEKLKDIRLIFNHCDSNVTKICDLCYNVIYEGLKLEICDYCDKILCEDCYEFEDEMGAIDCCNIYSCINSHTDLYHPRRLDDPNFVECPSCNHYMCQEHLSSYRCDYCKEECTGCELIMFSNEDGTNFSSKCLMKQMFVNTNNLTFYMDQYVVDIIYQYYDKFSK